MLHSEILKELSQISAEEQAILSGRKSIDRTIYMEGAGDVVNSRKLLSSGKIITVRKHTRFIDFPEHTHDYVEVVYMCAGSTDHIVNGRQIHLGEGELLFLGQNATQSVKTAGKGDIAVNFIVLPDFFSDALSLMGEEDTPLKSFITDCLCGGGGLGYLHFKVSGILPIQNLVENLIWTLIHDTKIKRGINRATMGLLFLHLLNHTDRLEYGSEDEEIIMKVLRYIEDNYANGSLTEAARLVHHDVCWLSREIKRRTGSTYTRLVQQKRLSQAAFLLKNTDMKISDISLALGYDNISYFHRLFCAEYGVTPKKWRACK